MFQKCSCEEGKIQILVNQFVDTNGKLRRVFQERNCPRCGGRGRIVTCAPVSCR